MTIPVQPKVDDNRTARAPYNFIPLPEKVITVRVDELPDQGVYDPDLHTGYIECELTTSSPVYVRAGLPPEQAKAGKESKDLPDFFYLNDKNQPVIPGSSLRGMLRTLVEIVTFSKIGSVSNAPLVYRSVGGTTNHDAHYRDMMMHLDREEKVGKNTKFYTPLMRGGYMVKTGPNDWAIRPAKVIGGTTYAHIGINEDKFRKLKRIRNCQNAYEIYIQTGPYQYQDVRGGFLKIKFAKVTDSDAEPRAGLRRATLARSGWMNSKRSEAVVYEADPDVQPLELTDAQVDSYIEQVSKEQEKLLGKNGVLHDGQPVFYIEKDGKVVFFGHTRMFRMPYPNSPFDYVPDYARTEEQPKEPGVVDFAEAMFGYTRKVEKGAQRQRAYAGRVFCLDAELVDGQKDIWLSSSPVTPKILSGPKPTTFQHYLVQPEPNFYEIGKTRDGETKNETRLRDFASPTPDETVIRGHKFYWHKGQVGLDEISEKVTPKDGDTQHTLICPLKAGVSFMFHVRFENLSDEELGALLFVLEVLGSDEHMRLKIGMGKPLGMGAVKITEKLFLLDPSSRYQNLFINGFWNDGLLDAPDKVINFLQMFKDKISSRIGTDLIKSPRIRALLMLLSWPGVGPEITRYMEIEHKDDTSPKGKVNEYRERPVLPTPFGVWSKFTKKETPISDTSITSIERTGVVISFGLGPNESYGYVQPDESEEKILVHKSQLINTDTLMKGQKVSFVRRKGLDGKIQAFDVKIMK